jgi:hypothetical protein
MLANYLWMAHVTPTGIMRGGDETWAAAASAPIS